ncbi:outer membrane beta-barrel protein [Tamlana sp. 2_MG-2023]|uniref:outer membrane beta-barrel protein n=1 Tax=unclassified Tamlana TaxID=2614803 RepID=UPI0026E2F877|nr:MULTISPECIES: outer membrane beta-barrel protein [unclassified Tamlana]MDO6761796.1 outer membrane beta-barrel protein [Tamlana sp. 2_MG-2023]MDO6792565.1 outer membrane beta-barrel protein [Tamlana sp. 1_MG-2023]
MTNLKLIVKKGLKKERVRKKLLSVLLIAIIPSLSLAQADAGWGVKGGLNYNANGDYFDAAENAYKDPTANAGFHIGVFGKTGGFIFLKPELVYTNTKTDYDENAFKMQKIDGTMLAGIDIFGPLSLFAGPSFQYIIDSDFESLSINELEKDYTVGLNIGLGFNLKRIGIDLRYERAFTKNEASIINSNFPGGTEGRLDTRSNQLILSLSLLL